MLWKHNCAKIIMRTVLLITDFDIVFPRLINIFLL
jgi:hypothetical protein